MPRPLLWLLVACVLAAPARGRAEPVGHPAAPQSMPALPAPALAAPVAPVRVAAAATLGGVAIRTGDHDGFGRVAFDLPSGASAVAAEQDGALLVRVTGAGIGRAGRAPRNVLAIAVTGSEVRLTLAPRATWRTWRRAGMLVIDVQDAPAVPEAMAGTAAMAAARPMAGKAAPAAGADSAGQHGRVPPHGFADSAARHGAPPVEQAPLEPPAQAPPPPPHGEADAAAAAPPAHEQPQAARAKPAAPAPQAAGPAPAAPEVPEPAAPEHKAAAAPEHAPAPPAEHEPAAAPAGAAESEPPGAAPEPEAATQAAPAPAGGEPSAPAASGSGPSVALPFAAGTGAAAFRRGAETVVVFDERRPLDLDALADDPVFGTARVRLLPAATMLRMTLPPDTTLRLAHGRAGWTLTQVAADRAAPLQPIPIAVADGRVLFSASAPGAVISVPDPDTGGALLVGTQKAAGEGAVVTRHTPAFTLLASMLGVAVEPISDALSLHVATKAPGPGFLLTAEAGRGLSLDPPDEGALAAAAAAHLTRRWDFPNLPLEQLSRRLQAALSESAAAAPQARAARRIEAVQAQLALGLGAEAHALATFAGAEDARAGLAADTVALDAVASLVAGRVGEADAIEDPRISGSDEVTLWRTVRRAMRSQASGEPLPEAAAMFATTLPLVLAYPAPLRERLLPLVVETMAMGGERAAAHRVVDERKNDASLDFARALLDEADGHNDAALATLDRLTRYGDRKLRVRAGVHAGELRLRSGIDTSAQAADALDRMIYAWRGDSQELALRLRVAELRVNSNNWRAALELLRETGGELSQLWPDQREAIHARMVATFGQAMAQDARTALPALDLVTLVEENPDLLPEGEPGNALAARLADRLASLDLPSRAMLVLAKLMAATPSGVARAEFGARLAEMRAARGDAEGALLALSASTGTDLPAPLTESRTITFARATAARGGLAAAVATLAEIDSAAADDARAGLLEGAKSWPAAVGALSRLAARTVPETGTIDEPAARLLLRVASAAAQAGDEKLLARLRYHDLPRVPPGKLSEMLSLLTETPVEGVSDLPRAAMEAKAARALPAALSAMAAPPPAR